MKKTILLLLTAIYAVALYGQKSQYTNLPTIYIETTNHQSVTSKENYVQCKVSIVSDDESVVITDKEAGIRGRGNSTWGMAKKPYRIKFDKKIKLFDRPAKAKSWVLLANYADKTLMRNAVAFEISRFVGFDFSPSAVFADVVLNGSFLGNYLVSDQMQVGSGRVDIDEMDATCTEGDALTGGYFLEIDGFGDSEPVHFKTPRGLTITVKSPDEEVIQPVQLTYITNYIRGFENTLFSSGFDNPDGGFRACVDERSLVDWYICCELTGNSDSFWSTYIYKKRSDDKLYFGPLWDFDIAFNNDNRLGDAVNRLMRDAAHDPKTWIQRMWQAEWFRTAVYQRWCELRAQGIEQFIIDYIDATAEYIDESQRRNFQKWNVLNTRVYREQFLFPTYKGGVDYLKRYVHDRIAFLDASFAVSGAESIIDGITDGQQYHIIHYVGLYATSEATNFYIRNPEGDTQKLTFVATPTPGVWNIRTIDNRLVASKNGDKYCTYITNGNDPRAQFTVEASPIKGYARFKNLYTGKYLGIEHTAHNSRISTNKDGTSNLHAWKILPVDFTGITAPVAETTVLSYDPHSLTIVCSRPADCEIYTIDGRRVASQQRAISISTAILPRGLYIARTSSGEVIKFVR